MEFITAQLRFFRQGPRKVRLVADMIRGRRVTFALDLLTHLPQQRSARALRKLLDSAVANAKHNHGVKVAETLRVKSITVDGGPVLKRFTPRAHGRATPIRERTSHIKLMLEEIVNKDVKIKD